MPVKCVASVLSVISSTELAVFSEHQHLRDQRGLDGTTVDLPDQNQDASILFKFNQMFIPVIYITFLFCFLVKGCVWIFVLVNIWLWCIHNAAFDKKGFCIVIPRLIRSLMCDFYSITIFHER